MQRLSATTMESLVLLLVSVLGVVQGVDLIIHPDPIALYDEIGPGRFVLVMSVLLMVAGAVYLVRQRAARPAREATGLAHVNRNVLYTMTSLVVYVALMDVLGFVLASILFLFLLFSFSRHRPWFSNALLAIIYVLLTYTLFVQIFNMELPRGLIAEKWMEAVLERLYGLA